MWNFGKCLRYILRFIASILLTAANYVLAWFVVLFQKDEQLPKWLSWFMTPDANLTGMGTVLKPNGTIGGGDIGFYERWKNRSPYLRRVAWLYRNPTNYFDEQVLGFPVNGNDMLTTGDLEIKNRSHAKEGRYFINDLNSDAFEFYYIKRWSKNRCIRARIGYKIKSFAIDKTIGQSQFVFVVNPFMTFEE